MSTLPELHRARAVGRAGWPESHVSSVGIEITEAVRSAFQKGRKDRMRDALKRQPWTAEADNIKRATAAVLQSKGGEQ
jgi:hypothetical protein